MEGERDDGQSGRVTTAHFASLIIQKVKTMVTMMMTTTLTVMAIMMTMITVRRLEEDWVEGGGRL